MQEGCEDVMLGSVSVSIGTLPLSFAVRKKTKNLSFKLNLSNPGRILKIVSFNCPHFVMIV